MADLTVGSASPFLPAVSVCYSVQQWQEELTQVARPPCQDIVWFQGGFQCIRSLTFSPNIRLDLLIYVVIQYNDLSSVLSHCQSVYDQMLVLHDTTICLTFVLLVTCIVPSLSCTEFKRKLSVPMASVYVYFV